MEVKIEINRVILHPAQLMESYKSCPLVALKMSIFLALLAGLSIDEVNLYMILTLYSLDFFITAAI